MNNDNFLYQINVTRACNLRCNHCYIHNDIKDSSGQIEINQLISLADQISEHLQNSNRSHAEIHIIGGEPTTLGLAYFAEAIPEFRAKLKASNIHFEIILVSNLLSEDSLNIAQFFDKVCTSYEPETRFNKAKLLERWEIHVGDLLSNELSLGVTSAMTLPVINYGANQLLDYLYQLGLKQIHLGFFIPEGDGLVNIDTVFPQFSQTSNFLIEAAQWYFEKRDNDPDLWLNPIESLLYSIHHEIPANDIVCPVHSGSIDIHWDGNTETCLEAGGATNPQWLGNVFEESIKQVSSSKKFKKRTLNICRPKSICLQCDAYQLCKAGCSVLFKYWQPSDDECPGFKGFINYIKNQYDNGIRPKLS